MRALFLISILCAAPLVADLDEYSRKLMSDDFKVRQKAEEDLITWAKKEDKDERAEAVLQRYLTSKDPEEYHRLTNILLKIHFELKKASIPQKGAGFIGISMAKAQQGRFRQEGAFELEAEPQNGVLVAGVIPETPADKAGLEVGDIITEIDKADIAGGSPSLKLIEIVGGKTPGTTINLTVLRGEEKLALKVTLMNREAVPPPRFPQEETRIDFEKVDQLLKEDYLRWLADQRKAEMAHEKQKNTSE